MTHDSSDLSSHRFVRACLRQPVDRTPVWFLRQAGRYMREYMEVRRHHSLVEICKRPDLAAEVTITAAEKLDVDAAIIFADLLLPLESMGLDFEFQAGEGPVIHKPLRTAADIDALVTTRAAELSYVGDAIQKVVAHFHGQLGMIGFCGAPFTLASYMIEGGGSRNYIETKKLMYRQPDAWRKLLDKLIVVLKQFAALQVAAGADVMQIFDSWAGALAIPDYREFVLPATKVLVREVQSLGVPVIYFGVDTASLSPAMREAEARAALGGRGWAGSGLANTAGQGMARTGLFVCSAGESGSDYAVRGAAADSHPRAANSGSGGRKAWTHFQSRARNCAGDAG